jgi:hypothetical protein
MPFSTISTRKEQVPAYVNTGHFAACNSSSIYQSHESLWHTHYVAKAMNKKIKKDLSSLGMWQGERAGSKVSMWSDSIWMGSWKEEMPILLRS